MNFVRKVGPAVAGLVAIAVPLMIGVVRAQEELRFEVASIKPSPPRGGPDQGGFTSRFGPGSADPTHRAGHLARLDEGAAGERRRMAIAGRGVWDSDGAPTLFKAVQEQLGLKLEQRKGTMDVIVVDRAERSPTAN